MASPPPVAQFLRDLLHRWDEILIQYGEQNLRVKLSEVEDQSIAAAIVTKLLIETYHLDQEDEHGE